MRAYPPDLALLKQPFYFLRHGESTANAYDTIAGSRDVPLTERGCAQAQAAAAALVGRHITAIYSSGLKRARDTAALVGRLLCVPVTVIPQLAERTWGALEGKPRALRRPGILPPGAETPEQFERRVIDALALVPSEGVALIVSHAGVFRVLCGLLGIAVVEDRIANALPVLLVPPLCQGCPWTFEVVSIRAEPVLQPSS